LKTGVSLPHLLQVQPESLTLRVVASRAVAVVIGMYCGRRTRPLRPEVTSHVLRVHEGSQLTKRFDLARLVILL